MAPGSDEIRHQIEQTRERMSETADALSYKVDVKSRVGDAVRDGRDQVRDFLGGATTQASRSEEMNARGRQTLALARDNPLALAVGAAALGLLIGLSLPSTRAEDERFGAAADSFKDHTLEVGQEAFERGRTVVQDAAQSAAETARDRASTEASELRDSAEQKAAETGQEMRQNLESN